MIRILYSYGINDSPELFRDFLAGVRSATLRFVPFDHRRRLGGRVYVDAYRLDVDWRRREPLLMALYRDLERALADSGAQVFAVDNDNVYHPEFLRSLGRVYKILVSTDDPVTTYARTLPYVHAFDHVTVVTPDYNDRVDMVGFLREVGATRASLKPMGVTPFTYEPSRTEDELFSQLRTVEMCFVGSYYPTKSATFRRLFSHFGNRLVMHGFWGLRGHVKYLRDTRSFRLVTKVSYREMVRLYQRSRISVNISWDRDVGLGNMRLFQLPANGVMQVSTRMRSMATFYEPGREIVEYDTMDQCVDLVEHYLRDDAARVRIALAGWRRTMKDYRFETIWERLIERITPDLPGNGVVAAARP